MSMKHLLELMRAVALVSAISLSTYTIAVPVASAAQPVDETSAQCSSLQRISIPATSIGLPTRGAAVTKATFVTGGAPNVFGEYCLVDGEVASVNPHTQKIKFQVAMPSRWNHKLLQLGVGFLGGPVRSPTGPELAAGYVTFDSDNGNGSGPGLDASFALNEEQFRNFAGDQLKKTHDAVMFLLKARYGMAPMHSYFTGGSEGGREAFLAIQRYPEDYDGVVAVAPANDITAIILKWQLIRRAMRLNDGAGWINNAKADFLRQKELSACDKLDGLEDSIISNGDACKVDFKDLRCPGGKDTGPECLSDAQLNTLHLMHSQTHLPYQLANGVTSLPAYAIGADYGIRLTELNYSQVVDTFVRYFFLRDPNVDTLTFDPLEPGRWLARVRDVSRLLDSTSLDIDRFIARGGKWIVIQGRSDPGVPAFGTIEYYQRLVAKYGQAQTDSFLRFYLIPGMGHGEGLSFNAQFEPLTALEAWVERGVAPQTLTATDANPEAHGRSRPMCAYPGWPQYKGAGDFNLASSFSCAVNH